MKPLVPGLERPGLTGRAMRTSGTGAGMKSATVRMDQERGRSGGITYMQACERCSR